MREWPYVTPDKQDVKAMKAVRHPIHTGRERHQAVRHPIHEDDSGAGVTAYTS